MEVRGLWHKPHIRELGVAQGGAQQLKEVEFDGGMLVDGASVMSQLKQLKRLQTGLGNQETCKLTLRQ